eukprot:TRINITY_DN3744_c0_g1_i4.p1 TRINITY_DN3744_c0_g1~~TRINITY_DN3744_c0_g1_i4.p1  ORF type:complete len:484 (+),score=126.48 TRINITY_DN3744_c0_g1_i4:57-1508(+)
MSCCVYVAERVERCGRVRGPTELLGCRVGRRAWVATAVGACYTRQSDGVVGVLLPPDAPAAAGVSVCLRQSTEAAPGVWPATADTRLVILSEALCRTGIAGADSRTADATLYKAVRAVAQRPTAPPPPPPRPDNQARRALAVPSSLAAAAGTSCLCCIVGCRLNALRRALQSDRRCAAVASLFAAHACEVVLCVVLLRAAADAGDSSGWAAAARDGLCGFTEWLLGYPAGFKANEALNRLLGSAVWQLFDWWASAIVAPAVAVATAVAQNAASSGWALLGAGLWLGAAADLLQLTALPLFAAAAVLRPVQRTAVQSVCALARLFGGRRWNPLRLRTDECEYDAPRTLLGTLLFTVLCCLLPTLSLYHALLTGLGLAVSVACDAAVLGALVLALLPLDAMAERVAAALPWSTAPCAEVEMAVHEGRCGAWVVVRGRGSPSQPPSDLQQLCVAALRTASPAATVASMLTAADCSSLRSRIAAATR